MVRNMEVRHDRYDAVENVEYWREQTRAWMDANVYGKMVEEIVGIAGDVVVCVGDGWDKEDVEAAADGLYVAGIPVDVTRGTDQIRIAASDKRLSVPVNDE